jgi:hypothetical protein
VERPSAPDVERPLSGVLDTAPAGTGRALKEGLRKHPPDPEWASELRELREFVGFETGPDD